MEVLTEFLSDANRTQVLHYGTLFIISAFIHARQVRKEIKLQFMSVTEAVNGVTNVLKEDLAKTSKRLDNIEKDVTTIKGALKL